MIIILYTNVSNLLLLLSQCSYMQGGAIFASPHVVNTSPLVSIDFCATLVHCMYSLPSLIYQKLLNYKIR